MTNRNRFPPGWWIVPGVVLGLWLWIGTIVAVSLALAMAQAVFGG